MSNVVHTRKVSSSSSSASTKSVTWASSASSGDCGDSTGTQISSLDNNSRDTPGAETAELSVAKVFGGQVNFKRKISLN